MSTRLFLRTVNAILRWVPLIFLTTVLIGFGALSPRFLSVQNLGAILVQSSWLMVVALGVNFVLLTADVDLSVGAAMYLAAVVVGMGLSAAPAWICLLVAVLVGSLFGVMNGLFVIRLQLPAFIATLATTFIGRGLGLFLSSTKMVFAGLAVTNLGRAKLVGAPMPLFLATVAVLLAWLLLHATPFGSYIRSVGADREGASRAGVPSQVVTWSVFGLSGAFAGLGGFISLTQTSAASAAFGQGAEFSHRRGGARRHQFVRRPRQPLGSGGRGRTDHDCAKWPRDDQREPVRLSGHYWGGNISSHAARQHPFRPCRPHRAPSGLQPGTTLMQSCRCQQVRGIQFTSSSKGGWRSFAASIWEATLEHF